MSTALAFTTLRWASSPVPSHLSTAASLPTRGGCMRSSTTAFGVRLYSRAGNDLTERLPLIVEALTRLRSCAIDGQAVACGEDRIASFDRIRYRHRESHRPSHANRC
jgi:hypothetical protein